jgi:hypothetical protein
MSTEDWLWLSVLLLAGALVIMLKAYSSATQRIVELEFKLFARETRDAFLEATKRR